ncbi:MAG: hypothetical protein E6J34_15610 [Chloroflexi bacterium]|nr:MAG: hypothetical protein E6J34_15610 [Chloroflexota bacterium]
MTQAEADKQLDKVAPGWYKTIRELQRKINIAEAGSSSQTELQVRLNDLVQQNATMAEQYHEQCQYIYNLYHLTTDSNDQAISFPFPALEWPNKASTEAYLKIIALVFPMSYWSKITSPESKTVRDCVHDLIHPDKVDKLDQYLSPEDKTSICAIFNASAELVDREMQKWSGNRVKKAEWSQRWAKVQRDIQTAYLPQSESTPSFVVGLVFQDVYEMMEAKTRRDRERRQVQE